MHRSAAVAAALAGLIVPAAAVAAPADPTHNGRGFVRSESKISRTSVAGLNRHWAADIGAKGPGTALIGSDRVIVPGGPSSPGLAALDLETGKELWAWKADVEDAGAPVRSQSRIVAAGAGSVTAVDTETGKPAWTRAVEGGGTTTIAAGFNRVFVSTDRSLTTFKAETGAVRWTEKIDAPQRMSVTYGWLFTTQDGLLAVRRPKDGEMRWKQGLQPGKTIPSAPSVSRHTVYVVAPDGATGLQLLALDSRTGKGLWKAPAGDDVCASGECRLAAPVADDESVIVATPAGRVAALERTSGKERWAMKVGVPIVGDPVVSAGRVAFVATTKGQLLALSTRTGEVLWKDDLGAEPEAGPVVGAGSVVVRTRDGRTATWALG